MCGAPAKFDVASVPHKAHFKDNNRSDATLWWVKHCGSYREAVCLSLEFSLVSTTCEAPPMQVTRRPKRPSVYAYIGGGFEGALTCVSTIMVWAHGLAQLAATLAATMTLSHFGQPLSASLVNLLITPATITYACDGENFSEVQFRNLTEEYVNHLKTMVCVWPGELSCMLNMARLAVQPDAHSGSGVDHAGAS